MANELFQMIQKDHQEVKDILKKIKKTGDGATKEREDLFSKLKMEITPHMKAEEKVFYPPLREKKEAREDALQAVEEHHITEIVLKELDGMSKDKEEWMAKLSVFMELVEHHIEEEESKVFKDAEQNLDDKQLQSIFNDFKQQKEQIKSSM